VRKRLHTARVALVGVAIAASACSAAGDRARFETDAPATGTTALAATAPAAPRASDWQALDEPGAGGHITDLAIDPTDPQRVLVGGDLIGIGLSTDGGERWEPTFGLTNGEIARFTFHPERPDEVWVGTMGGPFVSLDGGRHWQARRAGLPAPLAVGYSAPVEEVLIDPTDGDHLLAFGGSHREWDAPGTTGWGTVWVSRDGGTTWAALATVAGGANLVDATWLADGTVLVAALGQGVQRSTDGGRTWTPSAEGLPHRAVRALAAHPTNPAVVWAALGAVEDPGGARQGGVWRSSDGGRSWQPSSNGLDLSPGVRPDAAHTAQYPVIAVSPADPDVLVTANGAFGSQAVFRSTDGGAGWQLVVGSRSITRPFTAYNTPIGANAVAMDPTDPRRTLIGNAEFVLATTDGGRQWQDLTSTTLSDGSAIGRGYSGLVATRVVFSPDGRELVLCGMDGANPLIRPSGAAGWRRPMVASDPWGGCQDAAHSRTVAGRRYVLLGQAGTFGGVATIEPDEQFRLAAGAAAGLPERGVGVGDGGAIEVVEAADGTELVAVATGGTLYVSDDGGRSFAVVDRGLGALELATDPTRPRRLYVAGQRSIAVSDDGGRTLRSLAGSPGGAARLTVTAGTGRLYATVWRRAGAGLWRLDGTSFVRILDEPTIYDVAADPTDESHLVVTTNDHPYHDIIESVGVLRSTDGGATWGPHNTGLPLLRVAAVAFDPSQTGRVVIGTFGRGFFVAEDIR